MNMAHRRRRRHLNPVKMGIVAANIALLCASAADDTAGRMADVNGDFFTAAADRRRRQADKLAVKGDGDTSAVRTLDNRRQADGEDHWRQK